MSYSSRDRNDIHVIKNRIKKYNKGQVNFVLDDEHKIKFERRRLKKEQLVKLLFDIEKIKSWEEQKHKTEIRHRLTYKKSNNYDLVIVFKLTKTEIKIITAFPRDVRYTKKFKKITRR